MTTTQHGGSASIEQPDYWWYRVRTDLLQTVLEPYVGSPRAVLDVGSADGPSVSWLRKHGRTMSLDVDPRGLQPGDVCGSALQLPFHDESFDVVAAFDVVEHCAPESTVMLELARVLTPGGRLLISVPAYQWAWSDFDEENGHHRRYTRPRAVAALEGAGLEILRSTYAFSSMFPLFVAERGMRRARQTLRRERPRAPSDVVGLPATSPFLDRMLTGLGRVDRRLLDRRNLPFGSSVVVAARKPARQG